MIGHVGGAPIEETLITLFGAGSAGASLLLARAWLSQRVRRPRERGRS